MISVYLWGKYGQVDREEIDKLISDNLLFGKKYKIESFFLQYLDSIEKLELNDLKKLNFDNLFQSENSTVLINIHILEVSVKEFIIYFENEYFEKIESLINLIDS